MYSADSVACVIGVGRDMKNDLFIQSKFNIKRACFPIYDITMWKTCEAKNNCVNNNVHAELKTCDRWKKSPACS